MGDAMSDFYDMFRPEPGYRFCDRCGEANLSKRTDNCSTDGCSNNPVSRMGYNG